MFRVSLSAMFDWFYVFAAVVLLGGGVVCFSQTLMRGAMGLLAVMLGVAGLYMRLHAEFLGVVQLALMAGGFLTALVVGVVMTRKSALPPVSRPRGRPVVRWGEIFVGVFLGVLMAGGLVLLVVHMEWKTGTDVGVGGVWDLGRLMLSRGYLLVVMLLGVVMGAALLGGAYMLRTRRIVEPAEPEIGIPAAPVMGRGGRRT